MRTLTLPSAWQAPFGALRPAPRAAVLACVALLGLAAAWLLLQIAYAPIFHSDSAAHQILAQAMVDEGSLLPKDFAYGNQLILWRNNLFIALALEFGAQGWRAYVVGSALNFMLFFAVGFLCIDSFLRNWRRSLLAAGLLFLPWGHTELDFVIGQQSHLAHVVLALAVAVFAFKARDGERGALSIACGAIVLLVVEAPTRSVLLLLPLAASLWLTGGTQGARRLAVGFVGAAVAGYALNKWLVSTHQVMGIPPMPLAAYEHFTARMNELLKGFVDFFVGFNQFQGESSKAGHLMLYGLKSLLLFGFIAVFAAYGVRLARYLKGVHAALVSGIGPAAVPVGMREFLALTGLLGLVSGAWIVCAIEYGLDVRHVLWALMLLKLVLVLHAVEWCARRGRGAVVALGLAFLLASTPVISIGSSYRDRAKKGSPAAMLPFGDSLRSHMRALGTRQIYGDHWEVLRLEVLLPGAQAGSLGLAPEGVRFSSFLTRLSAKCPQGEVLYLLDRQDKTQAVIADTVLAVGGRQVDSYGPTRRLYAGPPVWDRKGCR